MLRNICFTRLGILLILLSTSAWGDTSPAPDAVSLSSAERTWIASRLYVAVTTYFPFRDPDQRARFDSDYRSYLAAMLPSDDREAFDWATMRLMGSLGHGHTWFDDEWLERRNSAPLGFDARKIAGEWVVVASELKSPGRGDVIERIGGQPIQDFFATRRSLIPASSPATAEALLFRSPLLFPKSLVVTLAGGSETSIDRHRESAAPQPSRTTGRWLVEGHIAYIRIPSFMSSGFEATAVQLLSHYFRANTLILDLRGNPGGLVKAQELQRAFFADPYPTWMERSPLRLGVMADYEGYRTATTESGPRMCPGNPDAYRGKVIILTDRRCGSYCEDFILPFKLTKRARLIGTVTSGTYASTYEESLGNGMHFLVATTAELFPDGSQFEGVGLEPDVNVTDDINAVRNGQDVVLMRALEEASSTGFERHER